MLPTVCLKRSDAAGPILVSLAVDSSHYLYSAEIEPNGQTKTRRLARSRADQSATWTDVIAFGGDGDEVRIGVRWMAIDSTHPGRPYKATLAILDGAGGLAPVRPGSTNPVVVNGRIGPQGDPMDMGRINIVIS